jgi:cell fate regulator YaaT (PSP1 superfamily)
MVVGVRFRRGCKVYSFDSRQLELKKNDQVVVETVRGQELGEVVETVQPGEGEVPVELKPVLRLAGADDLEKARVLPEREAAALAECTRIVSRLELPMKLISAEYNLDASQLTIYFSADNRVDFRELVRELSHNLHARVELRQIGPRDEAKLLGGYGRCGRELCCASFLSDFAPVSIKMAKVQDLPLNPLKISGVCGRLLCCLGYEYCQYREMKEKIPRDGTRVMTDTGPGVVIGANPLTEKVLVGFETGARLELPLSKVRIIAPVKEMPVRAANGGRTAPLPAVSPQRSVSSQVVEPASAGQEPASDDPEDTEPPVDQAV